MSGLSRGRWNIHDFIKQHNHINYCEASIDPDGFIEYTIPCHFDYFMNKAFGINVEDYRNDTYERWQEMEKLFPSGVEAMDYLVETSGCVSMWFSQALCPTNMTDAQIEAIRLLLEHKIVDFTSWDHLLCINRRNQLPGQRVVKLSRKETDL